MSCTLLTNLNHVIYHGALWVRDSPLLCGWLKPFSAWKNRQAHAMPNIQNTLCTQRPKEGQQTKLKQRKEQKELQSLWEMSGFRQIAPSSPETNSNRIKSYNQSGAQGKKNKPDMSSGGEKKTFYIKHVNSKIKPVLTYSTVLHFSLCSAEI